MGFIDRIRKLWRKLTGGKDDPQQLFDKALSDFKERYRKSRDLVASVLRARDTARAALESRQADLIHVRARARAAVETGDDTSALQYIEREKSLERQLEELRDRVAGLETDAARAREMLLKLDAEVERLEHDRKQAAYLADSAGAHGALRGMLRDLDSVTASPELGRARDSVEHATLTQRYAQQLDEQDRQAALQEDSAQERLRQMKRRAAEK